LFGLLIVGLKQACCNVILILPPDLKSFIDLSQKDKKKEEKYFPTAFSLNSLIWRMTMAMKQGYTFLVQIFR